MIGRWGLYGDLFRELRKLPNITIDVAADAAKVADRVVRDRRDYCIRSAKESGMRIRTIARAGGHLPKAPMDGRISVRVDAAPPDRRVRDLDNISKALLDALTHAGVWRDDSQIDDLRIVRCDPERGGCVVVYAVPAGARSRIMSIGEKEAA